MKKERKHYTAEEKVAILRRHLLDKVPVSDLCEELGLRPTVFYRWQKEFFENGAAAFQAQERPHRQVEEKQRRIDFLEKKVQTKNEVLAELMAEDVALIKTIRAIHSFGATSWMLRLHNRVIVLNMQGLQICSSGRILSEFQTTQHNQSRSMTTSRHCLRLRHDRSEEHTS